MDTVVRHLRPDLILLGLPRLDDDGLACCRRWRAATPAPIVVVADSAPAADDVVAALETGADECGGGQSCAACRAGRRRSGRA